MIRISRPDLAPKSLTTKGGAQTKLDCAAFEADRSAYRSGKKKFSADRDIYGAKAVKSALMKAQHGKCCFCERKLTPSDHGDIEHFRPKGGVRQDLNTKSKPLGYYWLAYSWTNLLVSCSICNTTHKGIQFPLRNPSRRARNHIDSIKNEVPILVDPASEDPREHIRFRGDAPEALTPRGEATIKVLGLNRLSGLTEERLRSTDLLRCACHLLKFLEAKLSDESDEYVNDIRQIIVNSVKKRSEFSSMSIDLVEKEFGERF